MISCPDCGSEISVFPDASIECSSCLTNNTCVVQSDEYMLPPTADAPSTVALETTSFMDAEPGISVGMAALTSDLDTSDAVTVAGLTDFLSRPVRIINFQWNQSDVPGVLGTYNPWLLFFNNANIKYKLNNFAFIRCNLKLKFVLNASPFYFGSMRAAYQPLPAFKPTTIVPGTIGGFTNSELIPYSQQPGVWLKPAHSEGAELTLPFFYQRSFLRAQLAQDFTDMGTLRMLIYSALQSANGVTGQGVTVQVYAWAEDVVLAGPSVGLAMQGDEYGVGPVSGPASTVASIAGRLRSVPIIGKFATATEMGARAVSGIAKLFGFTNVPVIEPTMPFRPSPFPQLASTELGYPVEKLTLDVKNELAIDPSILGLPPDDELAIQNFATRPSYLCSSAWSTTSAVDTSLFASKVNTNMGLGTASNGSLQQFTPMAICARLFKAWRGDIIFTFRFIASPFHKGRVRVSYDPYAAGVQTTGDTGPTVFNQIIDLSAETEVDVRIPYQQALSWCYSYPDLTTSNFTVSTSPALTYADTFDNGILSVKVLTALTAPVATSTVYMQVFVRGAENIEFANPASIPTTVSPFVVQSLEYSEKFQTDDVELGSNDTAIVAHRARVHFGENVRSLRTLLRRSNFVDAVVPSSNTTTLGYWRVTQTRFPLYPGYDPSGWNRANGIVVPASSFPYNFAQLTPWHVVANCFLAQRGAMHWHYNWEGPTAVSLKVTRDTSATTAVSVTYAGGAVGNSSNNAKLVSTATIGSAAATALTNQLTNAGNSVSVPNYTVFKFESTSPTNSSAPVASGGLYDGSVYEGIGVEVLCNGTVDDLSRGRLERYASIGTDYSLYFFLNCPSLYYLNQLQVVPN